MAETKREKLRADGEFLMAYSMNKKKAENGVSV
jgi:predicted transposase YbfD/YdcC